MQWPCIDLAAILQDTSAREIRGHGPTSGGFRLFFEGLAKRFIGRNSVFQKGLLNVHTDDDGAAVLASLISSLLNVSATAGNRNLQVRA